MAETLRFDVIGRGDASDIRRLADAVELLIRRLRRLDNQDARPDVDVDTRRAERNLGRFATDMHRRIRRAIESLPEIDIDADSSDAQREITAIRAELAAMDDLQIGVDLSSVEAERRMRELQARLDALDNEDVDVQIRADAAAASAELARVEDQVDDLDGRTATVHVRVNTRAATRALTRFAGSLADALLPGGRQAAGPLLAALAAAAPLLGAIGAAAIEAANAILLLPAAGFAAAAGIGALVVGFQHMGDALGETGTKAQLKKVNEALEQLAPSARETVSTLRGLAGAWNDLRLDVQERLFRGVGQQIQTLADRYLPSLQDMLGGIADGFSRAATETAQWISQDAQVQRFSATFDRIRQSVVNALGGLQPFTEAFLTLVEVGSTRLPRLAQGLADAAARFRDWVNAGAASGELGRMIDRGIEAIRQLGQITINVGAILVNVFQAAGQAGVGMLDTLERSTAAMRRWTASAEGTRTIIAIFTAIRTAVNTVGAAISAFAASGAWAAAANAIVQVGRAVEQLIPVLGRVAGDAVVNLANAVSLAAAALTPLINGLAGVLGALGPIPGAVLAGVVAFRLLGTVGRLVSGLAAPIAAAALSMGVFTERATRSAAAGQRVASVGQRVSQSFMAMGRALPFIGIALIGLAVAMEEFGSKADEVARNVLTGTQSFASAVRTELQQLNKNYLDVFGREASLQGEFLAEAHRRVTAEIEKQLAAMGPMEQLQARVAMAQANLNDAVVQYGANSQQATAAATALAAANQQLTAAEQGADAAAKAHNQTLADRVGAVQTALGAMLQMEDALARVAEAETAANDAARKHGEGSTEAAAANRDFAQAADRAAQAVGEQARAAAEARGATDAAEVGARAYAATLVQTAAAAEGPARSALFSYIDGLSTAELTALNAAVATSGFATRVETLPSGRTVLIAVDPETGEIIEVQQLVDGLQDKTITINGNAMPAQDALARVLLLVAAGNESITINGQTMPAQQALQTVLGMVTSATGTVTINGQARPAQTVLSALLAAVNAGRGAVVIDGQVFPAESVLRAFLFAVNSSSAEVTLDANAQPVNTAKTQAQQPTESTHTVTPSVDSLSAAKTTAQQPTQSPHTINPNVGPLNAAKGAAQAQTQNPHTVGAPVTDNAAPAKATAAAPSSNTHTIFVNDAAVTSAKAIAQVATGSVHTIFVDRAPLDAARAAAVVPTSHLHTINVDESIILAAKDRARQPTNSMHTINVDDSAVTDAKARARQSTSSTHTIFVRVVGGLAGGAYLPQRAEGAFAAAYDNGGMRPMSANRANIVPPRQPRIIGDRMHGDEAFIPINQSRRSKNILAIAASRMGMGVTPMAHGGVLSAVLAAASGGGMHGGNGDGGALLEELRELSGHLRALRGDVDHHGDHAATAARLDLTNRLLARLGERRPASEAAQSWRTTAELGAF